MKEIKFLFGEDIKKYLEEVPSSTIVISASVIDSEYSRECEFITDTTAPSDAAKFEKYEQDGISFYVSKELDLSSVSTIKLKVKEYGRDLAGRDLEVELA